jgi:hypothetical protein
VSDNDSAWKTHLLRTSVPLEHEVARVLSRHGFSVSADYSYSRIDAGVEKEFSVDLRGVLGAGPTDQFRRECLLDVFIECKFRDRGARWLFLPQPRYARDKITDAVESVDLFSPSFVHDTLRNDDPNVQICYSAVEVGISARDAKNDKGRAIESQLKHGVRQLQYAIPSLIMLRARTAALLPPEESFPFFFASVLVTNARLIVADEAFGIAAVEAARELDDVGKEVPYLVWSAAVGPDFYQHCQRQFAGLAQFAGTPSMRAIEEKRKAAREASWVLPSVLARRVAIDPTDAIHIAEFKNVIVTNIAHVADVLAAIAAIFRRKAGMLKEEPLVKW